MADQSVEFRREMRRRKILQNSEERLKKFFGSNSGPLDSETTVADLPKLIDGTAIPNSILLEHDIDFHLPDLAPAVTQPNPAIFNRMRAGECKREKNLCRNNDEDTTILGQIQVDEEQSTCRVSSDCQNQSDFSHQPPSVYSFPKILIENKTGVKNKFEGKRNGIISEFMVRRQIKYYFFKKLLMIMVSLVMVYWVHLSSEQVSTVFMSIFGPFILLEGSLFAYELTWSNQQSAIASSSTTTIVVTTLMLCGVTGNAAKNTVFLVSHLYQLSQDFALFLFCFLLCYRVVSK